MHNKKQITDTAKILNQNINWWLKRFNLCLQNAMRPDLTKKQCAKINAEFGELMGRGSAEQKIVERHLRDWARQDGIGDSPYSDNSWL